jgi:transposase InsO family protein
LTAANVLKPDFRSSGPNQKWATDVTEFKLLGQKQYLSPVIDLFNGEVISYELAPSPVLALVIIHSDQGWHYHHLSYQKALAKRGLVQSMSRKGNCLDSAVAENFFGYFKEESLWQQTLTNISQFKTELDVYLNWSNNDRIKLKLKGLSPVQYRTQSLDRLSLAPD